MTDHALALQTITFAGFAPAVAEAEPTIPAPTDPGHATRWQCVAVDMSGNVLAFVPVLGNPTTTYLLNVAQTATFKVSMDVDVSVLPLPNAATTPTREVQLYRNGQLIIFGPVVARRANTKDRVWEYTCYDPQWYFSHRYFGEASRHNYLPNGSFEVDLTGWATVGAGITATQTTARSILGTGSMKLVGTVDNAQTYQVASFPMTAGALGLALYVTGWVFVESFTNFAAGNAGLYIGQLGNSATQWAKVNMSKTDTPVGKWSRVSTVIEMPPNVTQTIEVRAYAPHGTVYWDALTVTVAESVSFVVGDSAGGAGWDQTTIAQQIVRYLAGAWPVGANYTKSDLRIAVAGDPSGIFKERTYQFSDHQLGQDALDEFTRSSDGFDFRVDCTPTSRVFRTYWPSLGVTWPTGTPFRYQRNVDTGRSRTWGIVSVDWSETVEGAASDLTEYGGWGTGAGREEAAFSNPAAFGGLTLEVVEAAPTEASIDLLSAIATSRGAQLSKPILTPVLTMVEPKDPKTGTVLVPLIGVLKPGDIIPVVVDDGSMQLSGAYRVAQVTVNEDETLAVAISP